MSDGRHTSLMNAGKRSVSSSVVRRRDLVAALWAAIAGLVFKATSEPLSAAAGLQFQNLAGGDYQTNIAGGPTLIQSFTGYSTTGGVFTGLAHPAGTAMCGLVGGASSALYGPSMRSGVWGYNDQPGTSAGVLGENEAANGTGVWGRDGLQGRLESGIGVRGESRGGIGVLGHIPPTSDLNATPLYGLNYSTYAGPGAGAGGFGVYGLSAKGHGLVGATAAPGAAAVVGATNGVAGAYAGAFYGAVIVSGNFTVVGGAKSAAVPHPDGSHRRLYCVESPESWFDDYGRAKLVCGDAFVTLDRDFAAIVNTDEYHVFLTGYDGLSDLSVYDTTADGFHVKAMSGRGDGTFSWRVVAKRKDIAAPRFESVEIPKEPTLPAVPDSVYLEPAKPLDLHRAMSASGGEKGRA